VEFSINHCCVDFVCAEESIWNIFDGIFGRTTPQEYPTEITIKNSSSNIIGDYSVSIKTGTYSLDEQGYIKDIVYLGQKIK